jgi:hypothetical protein
MTLLAVGLLLAAMVSAGETPEHTNTLRWKTASEVENFGFDVYRGDAEEGPFERLTETPIPGAGTVDEPQDYVFVDRTIDPRRAYWYYVESISLDGVRERFTPVFRAAPKIVDEAEGDAADSEAGGDPKPEG